MASVDGAIPVAEMPLIGDAFLASRTASSSSSQTVSSDDSRHIWLVAAWIGIWVVSHFILWPLWNPRRAHLIAFWPTPIDRYRKRLARSQVYCFICVVGGFHLLYYKQSWNAKDLLYSYSPEHEMLFAMAVAHWMVSIWEDLSNWRFLSAGLSPKDMFTDTTAPSADPNFFLARAYLVHHMVAAAGFFAVLHLRACVAVCTFGLIFELPVLFMNHREFVVYADRPPQWFKSYARLQQFWRVLVFSFISARFGPTIVYIYSLLYWWEDLTSLDIRSVAVYHCMATFFTALNYAMLCGILPAWQQRDLCKCLGDQEKVPLKVGRYDWKAMPKDMMDEEKKHVDEEVKPVKLVTRDELKEKDGTNEEDSDQLKETWVLIDGAVFNVTKFMKEHPGGQGVFKKHAGQDASEGFHKARHSVNAKRIMQFHLIGPIEREFTRYKIFEHGQDLKDCLKEGFMTTIVFAWVAYGFLWTGLLKAEYIGHREDIWIYCVPGCILTLSGSIMITVSRGCGGNCPSCFVPGCNILALSLIAFTVGFFLARRPLTPETPADLPTGFEIAGGLLYFAEDIREFLFKGGSRYFTGSSLVVLALAVSSWSLRGGSQVLELGYESLLGGVLMSFSMYNICRFVKQGSADKEVIASAVLNGISMCGPWSLVVLAVATSKNEKAETVLQAVRAESWFTWLCIFGLGNALTVLFLVILNSAYGNTPAWVCRFFAFIFCMSAWAGNGLGGWRWLFVLAFMLHWGCLNGRLREQLEHDDFKTESDKMHRIGTQAVFDQLRISCGAVLWKVLCPMVVSIVKALLPEELTVYACDIPIFDLGDDVDLGIAAYFAPPRRIDQMNGHKSLEDGCANGTANGHDRSGEDKPNFFVCNVGHIDTMHPAGLNDLQRTMNTLRDCWSEFQTGDVKGLVSNVVAVFPFIQGSTAAKEVNLSAWASEEDAHDWYATSRGHRDVMRQHTGGQLRTFGNLLASLKPVGKVRFQDRCSRCSRLVESKKVGELAPPRCEACGAKTFDYPSF